MRSDTRATRWFLLAGVVVLAGYYLLPAGPVQDLAFNVIGLVCLVPVVVGIRRHRPPGAVSWWLICAGLSCFVIGDIIWNVYTVFLHVETPFPGYADLFYLSGYPLLGAALWRSGRSTRDSRIAQFDAAVFVAAGLVPMLQFLVLPLVHGSDQSMTAMIVSVAYPVSDLLLLAVLVRLLLNGVGRLAPLQLMAAGITAMMVADIAFARAQMGAGYTNGSWFDWLWLALYVGAGGAALHPRMGELTSGNGLAVAGPQRLRLIFLAASAVVAPVLAVADSSGDTAERSLMTAAASVVAVLVVCRLGMTVKMLHARTRDLSDAVVARDGLTERLRFASLHDSLTGLPNRVAFAAAVRSAVEAGGNHVVVFCDLDEFKAINDDHGHATGDAVLAVVAGRFRAAMRPEDVVARLGGDEFGMLWRDVPSTEDAAVFAERLLATLHEPITVGARSVRVGASVGMTLSAGATREYADLLADADVAVYGAKRSGRGQAVFFEPGMRELVLGPMRLARRLTDALDADDLHVVFQPIVNTRSGRMTAVEALVRWDNDGTPMAPGDFLPVAADHGLIERVDAFVVSAALEAFAAWPGAPARLHVNASPQWLAQVGVVDTVRAALERCGVHPSRLTLEMTEYVFHGDVDLIAGHCVALRELGVTLALDDFGTGYSSLSYLQRFPFDALKLDRSLTALVDNGECPPILRAVVRLGHSLGLRVIAEGVETHEQMAALAAIDCDEVQGFVIAMPVPVAEVLLEPESEQRFLALPIQR